MKKPYVIVGFERIPVSGLEPHPDVMLPMDDEDREALGSSVGEMGVLQPLIVSAKARKEDGIREIYEGVSRWRSFAEGNGSLDYELPCILVEADNPRELALTFLGVGRKRSTGQRIMAYLEMHKHQVLQVAELISTGDAKRVSRDQAGHMTGSVIPKKLEDFTIESIAKKLRVSTKDVGLGIELLTCIDKKRTASWARGSITVPGEDLDMGTDAGKDYLRSLKDVHLGLLAGSTPIRRWKPAVGGRSKTEGKERAPIDYAANACRALRTLINAIEHWDQVKPSLKQRIATDWEELREKAAKVNLD